MPRRHKPRGTPAGDPFAPSSKPESQAGLGGEDPAGASIAAGYGEDVRATLEDLVEFGDTAARLVARGRDAYDKDEALRLASEAILHRVGEAAARLYRQSPEFIDDHPNVEWAAMRAIRNIVAHDYSRIDHEIVWRALEERMPAVSGYIRECLRDIGDD